MKKKIGCTLLGLLVLGFLALKTRAPEEHSLPASDAGSRPESQQGHVPVGLRGSAPDGSPKESPQLKELRRVSYHLKSQELVVAASMYVGDCLRAGLLPKPEEWEALGHEVSVLEAEMERSRGLGQFVPSLEESIGWVVENDKGASLVAAVVEETIGSACPDVILEAIRYRTKVGIHMKSYHESINPPLRQITSVYRSDQESPHILPPPEPLEGGFQDSIDLHRIADPQLREETYQNWIQQFRWNVAMQEIARFREIFGGRLSNLGVAPREVEDLLAGLLYQGPQPSTDAAFIYPWPP